MGFIKEQIYFYTRIWYKDSYNIHPVGKTANASPVQVTMCATLPLILTFKDSVVSTFLIEKDADFVFIVYKVL